MKVMRIITGIIDVLLGLVFLKLVVEMLEYIPAVVARYEQEPEDLLPVVVGFPLCAFISFVVFFAGIVLLRQRGFRLLSVGRLIKFLIACAVFFTIFSALNFMVNDPIWSLFLLPVPAIACSIYVLRKEFNKKVRIGDKV